MTSLRRWWGAWWLLLSLLVCALPAHAAEPAVLDKAHQSVSLAGQQAFWIDPRGQADVMQVESLPPDAFAPRAPHQTHLIDGQALWLRFQVDQRDPRLHGQLNVHLPGMDRATLYYRDSSARWVLQQAGDQLPMSVWPQRALEPVFQLDHEARGPVT